MSTIIHYNENILSEQVQLTMEWSTSYVVKIIFEKCVEWYSFRLIVLCENYIVSFITIATLWTFLESYTVIKL